MGSIDILKNTLTKKKIVGDKSVSRSILKQEHLRQKRKINCL